jgi:23S rRNA maturation mini-RNase III
MARNTRNSNSKTSKQQDETERYRQAAEDALQQLDWTIGYLHGIRKTDISKALAKNRSFIRKQLMGMPEEPLPTQQTDET